MLFVQTAHQKEQKILEEDFDTQDNYFAVPIKKASQIEALIDSALFQVFSNCQQDDGYQSKTHLKKTQTKIKSILLIKKLKDFVSMALKMKVSLSTLREIFLIIKKEHELIRDFREYNENIDKILEEDMASHASNNFKGDSAISNLEGAFEQNQICSPKILSINSDSEEKHSDSEFQYKLRQKTRRDKRNINNCRLSIASIQQNARKNVRKNSDDSANTCQNISHSLFQEVGKTVKFNTLASMFNANFQSSFVSNIQTSKDNSIELKNVEEQIAYDRSTNNTLYHFPQKPQKQGIHVKKSDQKRRKQDSSDQYLNNLSDKFKPTPSVLNDESFLKVARLETVRDIQKSKALRNSVITHENEQLEMNEKLYNSNIKNMKMQQKLKSTGKKHKSPELVRKITSMEPSDFIRDPVIIRCGSEKEIKKLFAKADAEKKRDKPDKRDEKKGLFRGILGFTRPAQKEKDKLKCFIE